MRTHNPIGYSHEVTVAGKTWKSHLIVGIGAFALIGAAACGSFKMPEGYGASGLLTGGPDGDTSNDPQSQSSGVNVPPKNAQPMDPSQFESLKAQVADEGMSSNKIALVEEAGRTAYFSATQARHPARHERPTRQTRRGDR